MLSVLSSLMTSLRRRPALLGLLLVLFVGPLAAGGQARGAAPGGKGGVSVAVLGLDSDGTPQEAAQALTDALRRRLAVAPGIRLVPGKDLVEMKLIFGCMDERPGCLGQAGRSLGAERLIYGSVRRPAHGGGHTVVLKQLSVAGATIEKFISDTVPAHHLRRDTTELEALVGRWLGVLVMGTLQGGLQVATDPPGAQVTLDGKPAGQTPLELREVPTGTHVAQIALPGYDQVVRTFTVHGGMVHELQVQLRRRGAPDPGRRSPLVDQGKGEGGAAAATAGPPDRGRPLRIASYFLLGAAAIAGGVSIYTWRTYTGEQDRTAQSARDLKGALDMGTMAWPASPAVNAFFQSSEQLSRCEPPPELTVRAMASPVSRDAYQSYLDHCRRGRSYADASTGLLATMGSLALVGVSSYILGQVLRPGRARVGPDDAYKGKMSQAQQPWLYRPRLTEITPAVGTSGGGLNLSFQF